MQNDYIRKRTDVRVERKSFVLRLRYTTGTPDYGEGIRKKTVAGVHKVVKERFSNQILALVYCCAVGVVAVHSWDFILIPSNSLFKSLIWWDTRVKMALVIF